MKKTVLFIALLIMGFSPVFGQESGVSMRISKEWGGKILASLAKPNSVGGTREELFQSMKKDLDLSGWIKWSASQSQVDQIAQNTSPDQIGALDRWQSIGTQILIRTAIETDPDGNGRFEVYVYHTDRGDRIFAKRYHFNSGKMQTAVHVASDDIIFHLTGEKGMASSKIAFVLDKTKGEKEVYICNYDGSNFYQITKDNSVVLGPDWAPDAKSLLYTTFRDVFSRIYIHNIYEGKRKRLAGYPGLNASAKFSPDGKKLVLVLSKDGNPEIYLSDLQGAILKRLTNSKSVDTSPAWSPDGSKIAFVSDRTGRPHIYIMNASSGAIETLTRSGRYNVSPDWSPKGDKIAFCSDQDGIFRIYVADLVKGTMTPVSPEGVHAEEPDWAPDNRHLVYSGKSGGKFALYVVDTLDGTVRLLASSGGSYLTPAWSS
ncbi:MAG: Tol-Pal system beta propeller repeat protein TolB [Chlamydiota bacterium]|nr:Tol-Pal system beta propeller repeat protein TolB [Chlamydiota bacterium]